MESAKLEPQLSDINRINIVISKLRDCMSKSEILKATVSRDIIQEVCEISKEGEELLEAGEKEICTVREKISRLRKLQLSLGPKPDPTAFFYFERLIFCLQVLNIMIIL